MHLFYVGLEKVVGDWLTTFVTDSALAGTLQEGAYQFIVKISLQITSFPNPQVFHDTQETQMV